MSLLVFKDWANLQVIEAKSGKKFNPGDFVYVRRFFQPHRIGMIIRYCGNIESCQTKEEQEVYEVLIGKKMQFFNEVLLDPLNETIREKAHRETN